MKGEGRGLGIHFPTFLNLNHPSQCLKKKSPMENNEVTLFRCFKKIGVGGSKRMRANI